jgi:hypothetical protein
MSSAATTTILPPLVPGFIEKGSAVNKPPFIQSFPPREEFRENNQRRISFVGSKINPSTQQSSSERQRTFAKEHELYGG